MFARSLFAFVVAASLLAPAPAMSAPDDGKPAKKRTNFTVRKQIWKGYGFLPGYPKTERERQRQRIERLRAEPRFYTYHGYGYGYGYGRRYGYLGGFYGGGYVTGPSYGFGPPGYVRGQWNGGSIGPCYTQTPIGFIWNCGM